MRPSDFPNLFSALSERRKGQVETAISLIVAALKAKEIANADYVRDVKEPLGRAFYDAWDVLVRKPFTSDHDYEKTDAESDLRWSMISAPQTNHHASYVRRIEKSGLNTPFTTAMMAFLTETKPLYDAIETLKGLAVKRKPKPESERRETYTAPKTSSKAEAAILETLRGVTDAQYETVKAMFVARYTRFLDTFMKAAVVKIAPKPGYAYPPYPSPHGYFEGDQRPTLKVGEEEVHIAPNSEARAVVTACTVYERDKPYRRREDACEIIDRLATKEADLIRETFITKNMLKLVAVTEAKGNFERIETLTEQSVSLMGMRGAFRLTFADTSSFQVKMQVVYHMSTLGTPFVRVPVTFHNVVLANGCRMSKPSEKRMNEVFSGQ